MADSALEEPPPPASLARSAPLRSEALAALSLFLVSCGVQGWLVVTSRIPTNSDQAIVGLMAKHILEGRSHPVFYYGATYAGSLEPHYVAAVFALFGASPGVYRAAMGLLVLLTMAVVYRVTRRSFGPAAGLSALAYLAIPPFFFLYKGLTSDGHYDAFNLFTATALGLALAIDSKWNEGPTPYSLVLALGLVIGLGVWINPLTPPISLAAVAWLFASGGKRAAASPLIPLGCGALVGSFPWWFWNARHDWASLKAAEMGVAGAEQALRNLSDVVRTSLPILSGARPFGTEAPEVFPGSRAVTLVALGVLLLAAPWRVAHGRRKASLFVLCFLALLLTVCWSERLVSTEPRFLFPFYVLLPPLIGAGVARLAQQRARRLLVLGAVVALLSTHLASMAGARQHVRNVEGQVTASLSALIGALESVGVQRVYTDYWTAYRLSFESGERILAATIPGEEPTRYPPYQRAVARSASVGIAVLPPRSDCFEDALREGRVPYARTDGGGYGIFFSLPPIALELVRAIPGLPLPRSAYRVSWIAAEHSPKLASGRVASARVVLRNAGPCIWPPRLLLGYDWFPLEPGLERGPEGAVPTPGWIWPGQTTTIAFDLPTPSRPGRYRLEYDLIESGIGRFRYKGVPPFSITTVVDRK